MTVDIVKSRDIGAVIRKRRKELCLSQEQLAERVGVSYQQIQRYENGNSMLNVENVQRIAHMLCIPLAEIFSADMTPIAAEPETPYASTDEKRLLRHFRDLSIPRDKLMVISLTRRLAKR